MGAASAIAIHHIMDTYDLHIISPVALSRTKQLLYKGSIGNSYNSPGPSRNRKKDL